MSGELQEIPARHGVATFVPRGRTIKIVNTYGKQVVSTWAFSLGAPPDEDDADEETLREDVEERARELEEEMRAEEEKEMEAGGEDRVEKTGNTEDDGKAEEEEEKQKIEGAKSKVEEKQKEGSKTAQSETDDPPEQAPDENGDETLKHDTAQTQQQSKTRTWSSYLPSMPYRSKGAGQKSGAAPEKVKQDAETSLSTDTATEKAKDEATSKKWSSYLAIGKSFSSYVPNVQIPNSKDVVSAFNASHHRDSDKSYAQQLYDFSRTPVGAASLAAATGSGAASSIYAAYSAYAKMNPSTADQPLLEYLSLPHTRAALQHLSPQVNDTLLTNLRKPIMTLIEDTTPGAHDTLTAACDAAQYAALGVDKPEEHGSCAENLVLVLKELNEKAGLTGAKAVGADVTVYVAPTPLHLFMNAPVEIEADANGDDAKGATIKVQEPTGKKRSYVRFKAERDIVVVMSACPMDVGPQNGGKCMAANFMVEEVSEEEMTASISSLKNASKTKTMKEKKTSLSPKSAAGEKKAGSKKEGVGSPKRTEELKKGAEPARRDSGVEGKDIKAATQGVKGAEAPKAKKKPKKLERRGGATSSAKTATAAS